MELKNKGTTPVLSILNRNKMRTVPHYKNCTLISFVNLMENHQVFLTSPRKRIGMTWFRTKFSMEQEKILPLLNRRLIEPKPDAFQQQRCIEELQENEVQDLDKRTQSSCNLIRVDHVETDN